VRVYELLYCVYGLEQHDSDCYVLCINTKLVKETFDSKFEISIAARAGLVLVH
jgi:predicted transcriptional regulator